MAFFTLVILACSGWYYGHSTAITRLDRETLTNSVDSTISNVTVRQFNQQGTVANVLTAPLMQHIPKGNVYLLQSPHILVSQEEQPPWNISSIKAESLEGGKQITFIGNVIVRQQQANKSGESVLRTEKVTYFPKEKKASSDVLVTYEQPGNIIQSTGMNAYLDEKRVELLHKARGSYVPANG